MSRLKTVTTVFLSLALVFGFTTIAQAQMGGRIAVKVVGENDQPLKGALVTVTSKEVSSFNFSKTTNKRGQVIVNFTHVDAIYDFKIEMEGYRTHLVQDKPPASSIQNRVYMLTPETTATTSVPTAASDKPAELYVGSKKERLYNDGVKAQQAGDFSGAIALFRESAEIDPKFLPAQIGIASAALEIGSYEMAAEAAEKAVALDSEDYWALQLRYDAYRNLGDEKKAAAAAQALKESGDVAEATARTFAEAVTATKAGNMEIAKARFKQALDLDPELVPAYLNLSRIYAIEGDAAQAAAMADEVLERRPGDLEALKVKYEASHKLGDTEAAKDALRRIIAADPQWSTSALFDQAQQLFNANKPQESLAILEQILIVNPDHPETLYLAGLCSNSSGDYDSAKKYFGHFLEVAPDHAEAATVKEILSYLP